MAKLFEVTFYKKGFKNCKGEITQHIFAECEEDAILVAIVSDYYRCTNCGHDTRQHVNGKIRYMSLTESDINFIKENIKE